MRQPEKAFSGFWMREMNRPGVIGWKRGRAWLWIGASNSLLRRLVGHNVIGLAEEVRDTDTICVWHSDSWRRAENLAHAMNHALRPRYSSPRRRGDMGDRACRACKRTLSVKDGSLRRWWQEKCVGCKNKTARIAA